MNHNNLNSQMDLYKMAYKLTKNQMINLIYCLIENPPFMYRFLVFLINELLEIHNWYN
jgi:hypothetical protein